jgi:SAM-dependent methyltransferase
MTELRKDFTDILVCPRCHSKLKTEDFQLVCTTQRSSHRYQLVGGKPIFMFDHQYNVFEFDKFEMPKSPVARKHRKLRGLLRELIANNKDTNRNLCDFKSLVDASSSSQKKILIVGSGEQGTGLDILSGEPEFKLVGLDVYDSSTVDVIADAHFLPFEGESFDGIVVQAVLEHVLSPEKVVEDLFRVLKEGGVIYSEIPFLQPVHEGAFDYTRFTVMGHRWLMRRFKHVRFGGHRGSNFVMALLVKHSVWSLFRSESAGRIAGVVAKCIAKLLDKFFDPKLLWICTTGTYFLGVKTEGFQLRATDLAKFYGERSVLK